MTAAPLPQGGTPKETSIVTFNVPAVHGRDSARALAALLSPVPGVADVIVNTSMRVVQVEYDDEVVTPRQLRNVIEDGGYLVQRYSFGRH